MKKSHPEDGFFFTFFYGTFILRLYLIEKFTGKVMMKEMLLYGITTLS
jgi:hypothetical protein